MEQSRTESIAKLNELTEKIDFCMLTTIDAGHLRSFVKRTRPRFAVFVRHRKALTTHQFCPFLARCINGIADKGLFNDKTKIVARPCKAYEFVCSSREKMIEK